MNKKITLLYVDDEPINLMLFETQFNRKYNVITAKSGDDALEILRSNPEIKVVISDMKMPGMNGIDFILLAKRKYPKAVYSILTGYDINEEINKALNNGLIFKYFRKPFDVNVIEGSINNALDSYC